LQGWTQAGRSRTLYIVAPSRPLLPGRGRQSAALGIEDDGT